MGVLSKTKEIIMDQRIKELQAKPTLTEGERMELSMLLRDQIAERKTSTIRKGGLSDEDQELLKSLRGV